MHVHLFPTLSNLISTGPGAYDHAVAIGSHAPSYSLSGRGDQKLESYSPGPGDPVYCGVCIVVIYERSIVY